MDKELLLYNYFANRLTAEQETLLEELLTTDSDFKQQFDFESDLKRVIREKEADNLKAKLGRFEKDISKSTQVKTLPRTNYQKWAMAASLILLVGLGWLGYNNFIAPDYGNLYDENFQQYPNTVYAITRGDSSENSLQRSAYVAYETDENSRAIDLFKALKETDNSEEITFYLGQSYLKNGQHREAITFFEEVIAEKGEFAPQALWYVALAYLKTDQKKIAVRALKDLIVDGRYKKTEAAKILKELE